jgi:hypothetical protein
MNILSFLKTKEKHIIIKQEEEDDGFVLFSIETELEIKKSHDMLEKERVEKERIEKERIEKERVEKERIEKERIEKERIEKERTEKERIEKERIEKERVEKERVEKERIERTQVKPFTRNQVEKYTNIEYAINALLHTFFDSESTLPEEVHETSVNDYYVYESIYSLYV